MTFFWNGIGVLLCGLAAILILRETSHTCVPYVVLTMGILAFLSVFPVLTKTSDTLNSFSGELPYGTALLKGAGVAMLTEIGVEVCRSVGENTTAGYVSLLGKAELLLLTMPFYRELIELTLGYLL